MFLPKDVEAAGGGGSGAEPVSAPGARASSDGSGASGGGSKPTASIKGAGGFLGFCRLLNILAGCSALLCLIGNSMALAKSSPLMGDAAMLRMQAIRLYATGLAALLALVETEWGSLLASVKILESWLVRGIVQGFLAVLTLEVATSQGSTDFDRSLELYRQVSGLCMAAMAGVYCLGGILCCGVLKQARYRRHAERLRMERDLELIEHHRDELKSLLASYSKD